MIQSNNLHAVFLAFLPRSCGFHPSWACPSSWDRSGSDLDCSQARTAAAVTVGQVERETLLPPHHSGKRAGYPTDFRRAKIHVN